MMDYSGMAQRLGQFRQAQVPGGGQRPMTMPGAGGVGGYLSQFKGMMGKAPGVSPQGMMRPSMPAGNAFTGFTRPQMQPMRPFGGPRGGGMGGGGSFGGAM
jgi:hypothetical protein